MEIDWKAAYSIAARQRDAALSQLANSQVDIEMLTATIARLEAEKKPVEETGTVPAQPESAVATG